MISNDDDFEIKLFLGNDTRPDSSRKHDSKMQKMLKDLMTNIESEEALKRKFKNVRSSLNRITNASLYINYFIILMVLV